MNERIIKLAEQAGIESRFTGYNAWYNEKFAELIVKECLKIIVNQTTLDSNEDFREGFSHGRKYAWTEIKKHFGVEK